jgi:hypothetical protein
MSALDKIAKLLDLFGGNQSAYGIPFANRNLIADGAKEVWSGTSAALTTSEAYTVNVLQGATAGAGGAGTYAQETFAAGAAATYGLARPAVFYGQFAQTTGSSGTLAANTGPLLYRRVENVAVTDGASFTLSLWLWVPTGTLNVTQAYVTQNFGTGGSPSASVTTPVAVNWALTTTPQRFSVLITPPSIVGKTIGTTAPGYTEVGLSLPVSSTFTLNDAQWQLEYSSPQAPAAGLPTAFEYRGQQAELARVQRYYETIAAITAAGGGYAASSSVGTAEPLIFKVTKRIAPSVSVATWSTSNCSMSWGAITTDGANVIATSTASGAYAFNSTAPLIADARL